MAGVTVRYWGTRGSIPTPGRKTAKYGGNTCCLELRSDDTIVVLDAGSGIRELGQAWLEEFSGGPIRANLLFTHLHWDHIQGFPFFAPAYQSGNSLTVFGEERPSGGIRELLGGQMQGAYFPVPLSAMKAQLEFRSTADQFQLDGLRLRTVKLPHPGGALAYRVESSDGVFVFATDCELELAALNPAEVQANPLAVRDYDPAFIDFFRGADLLVIDCQFLDDEYLCRQGWGHNGVATVADLCAQVRPHMVALFHHDPQHADDVVAGVVSEVFKQLDQRQVRDMLVFAAREGVTMRVKKPRRPAALPA
jgi:phosphoribosyl 1,2-cyclic phosphodiesterase